MRLELILSISNFSYLIPLFLVLTDIATHSYTTKWYTTILPILWAKNKL